MINTTTTAPSGSAMARTTSPWARLTTVTWARARGPLGILEGTRWLFLGLALLSLALTVPVPLVEARGARVGVILVSSAVLVASWLVGYRRSRAPLVTDLLDGAAVFGFAVACEVPSAVLGLLFAALWFRSLYGSARGAVLRCFLYMFALVGAVATWPHVFGRTEPTEVASVLTSIPIMFLTVVVGRRLAASLVARERGQAIGVVYAVAAYELIGLTDEVAIRSVARRADDRFCATTPGLRIMNVDRDGEFLVQDGVSGPWAEVPVRLPGAVLGDVRHVPGAVEHAAAATEGLDAGAGARCAWVCLPLPVAPGPRVESWLLLGAPGAVPPEAVNALRNLANHMALAYDVSQAHRELTVQATVDSLTGLANRTTFTDALAAALEDDSASDTSVLFVDLDDFKDVNDRFGHATGDETLREVAARLRRATRPGDLCARLGGDEFAVLLRATGGPAAAEAAQRAAAGIGTPMRRGGDVVRVGASVGSATAPAHSDPELLLHRADAAMYAAKARRVSGRAGSR